MNPRTFHLTAAAAITIGSLTLAVTTPVHAPVAAAVPSYRPAMSVKAQVISAALVRGYSGREVRCLVQLVNRENRAWNPRAINREGSSASGLFQHLRSPSGVMLADLTVPKQTERGLRYIATRYGTPKNPTGACNALAFHMKKGWY